MLSESAIRELLDDKDKLTEFSTASLIHAITAGVIRVKDPKTPASAVSQFIESLRKVRADLTGDNHEMNMPQMMVNIAFGQNAAPVEIDVTPKKKKQPSAPRAVTKKDGELLAATGAIFEQSNLFEGEAQ